MGVVVRLISSRLCHPKTDLERTGFQRATGEHDVEDGLKLCRSVSDVD